jgi:hypothetical protein
MHTHLAVFTVALFEFVHSRLNMVAVLVAILFHHLQRLVPGYSFDCREVNSGLYQVR